MDDFTKLLLLIMGVAFAALILGIAQAWPYLRSLAKWLRRVTRELGSRGEVADGPDYYDVDIVPGMREPRETLRDALVDVRADRIEVNRRLALIAEAMPDLAALPQQLEGLYVIEVER